MKSKWFDDELYKLVNMQTIYLLDNHTILDGWFIGCVEVITDYIDTFDGPEYESEFCMGFLCTDGKLLAIEKNPPKPEYIDTWYIKFDVEKDYGTFYENRFPSDWPNDMIGLESIIPIHRYEGTEMDELPF